MEPKLSPITSTKSKSSRSLRSSKLKEMKKSIELKKLIAEQAAELAQYEAEMEKKKIDIEMHKEKMARFKAQLAEKEYDLLSLEDGDSASNEENSVVNQRLLRATSWYELLWKTAHGFTIIWNLSIILGYALCHNYRGFFGWRAIIINFQFVLVWI